MLTIGQKVHSVILSYMHDKCSLMTPEVLRKSRPLMSIVIWSRWLPG